MKDPEAERFASLRIAINDRKHWVVATDDPRTAHLMSATVWLTAMFDPGVEPHFEHVKVNVIGTAEKVHFAIVTVPKAAQTNEEFRDLLRALCGGRDPYAMGKDSEPDLALLSHDPPRLAKLVEAFALGKIGLQSDATRNN